MSTPREAAQARAHDALKSYPEVVGLDIDLEVFIEQIIDAVMPVITEQKQLIGVPEGSLLITRRTFSRVYEIDHGYLVQYCTKTRVGKSFVEEYGPLTVVAMP